MQEKINKLIPIAEEAIIDSGIVDTSSQVEKEYKGYIASMGARILQSGLLTTIAFNSKTGEGSEKRKKILDAILYILNKEANETDDETILLKYVIKKINNNVLPQSISLRQMESKLDEIALMEERISDALVALKLALRIYQEKP
jgi:CRISPR type III-B/RAMP module-associated protein Cmr5